MTNLTKQGMADGVRGSAVFVLFLSRGVLERLEGALGQILLVKGLN